METVMRYYYIPIKMAKIQNTDNTKYGWEYGRRATLICSWWQCKVVQSLRKQFVCLLQRYIYSCLTMQWSRSLVLPKWVGNLHPHKNLHTDVSSSFIHNVMEATKMSFSRWMYKQTQPVEYYSALNRNELPSHERTWKNFKCTLLSNVSIWKVCMLCDSNCMTYWKSQNYGDNKKISIFYGLRGRERWIGRARRICTGMCLIWCGIICDLLSDDSDAL